MERKETYAHWFVCENILAHDGQLGILHMDEPEVFILIRNYGDSLFASFEEFCNGIAEVNFFHAGDREATDLTDLLTDAWNFLATHENEEENRYYENGEFEDDLGLE